MGATDAKDAIKEFKEAVNMTPKEPGAVARDGRL